MYGNELENKNNYIKISK